MFLGTSRSARLANLAVEFQKRYVALLSLCHLRSVCNSLQLLQYSSYTQTTNSQGLLERLIDNEPKLCFVAL